MSKRVTSTSRAKSSSTGGAGSSQSNKANIEKSTIKYIPILENSKLLPKYNLALSYPHDEGFPIENLDAMQLELEILLSSVAVRYRQLNTVYKSLDTKSDKKSNPPGPGGAGGAGAGGAGAGGAGAGGARARSPSFIYTLKPSTSSLKRKRADEKKTKHNNFSTIGSNISKNSPKYKSHQRHHINASSHAQQNPQREVNVPYNDIPNKFWQSVEPYCIPITHEDMKYLQDLLAEHSKSSILPIPELGPHYSEQWAAEDLREEQNNSNPAKPKKHSTTTTTTTPQITTNSTSNNEVLNMMKKGEKLMGEGVTGSFTQRLVSVFLEENLIDDDTTNVEKYDHIDANTLNGPLKLPSMLKNGILLEKRVKQELIQHGFLSDEEDDDEILAEIISVRKELENITNYNHNQLKDLNELAMEEMKRLDIKRQLDAVDQQIIAMQDKVATSKRKQQPITTADCDTILRLTGKQKLLSDQLDQIPELGPHATGPV